MKKIIIVCLFLSLWTTFAQNKSVQGDWIMAKIKTKNKTNEPFLIQRFTTDGKVLLRDFEIGTWKKRSDKLKMQSERYPVYNDDFEISFPTDNELLLKNNQTEVLLIKYDLKQMQSDSTYQNLIGTWKISGQDTNLLHLKNDGQFTLLTIEQDMNMTTNGAWLFLPKQKIFVLQGNTDILDGKNQIVQQGNDNIEVTNHKIHYQLEKIPSNPTIEHLSFKEDDLPENNSDESKLPWRDFYAMKDYLSGIKTLHYDKSDYYPEIKAFVTTEIEVIIENKDRSIKFINYYYPNEEAVKLSETIKGNLQNTYNNFFPQKDLNYYRVVDTQQKISVPAGTFTCTLVEGTNGYEKYRYWMINDKPSVFAKIIIENDGEFGNALYQKYELTEIEKKK
jgi:hypothetical protein